MIDPKLNVTSKTLSSDILISFEQFRSEEQGTEQSPGPVMRSIYSERVERQDGVDGCSLWLQSCCNENKTDLLLLS